MAERYTIRLLYGFLAWEGEASSLVEAVSRAETETGVYLESIDFSELDLAGIPVVPNIDRAILGAIEDGGALNMSRWHGAGPVHSSDDRCGTTHCRAGFAIWLAGQAGFNLEDEAAKYSSSATGVAGALIYAASRPGVAVPNFHVDDETAMDDIRACATHYSGR